jgi:5-methylcytosine-specific restriction endonuclease McrA
MTDYQSYLRSEHWMLIREAAKYRAGYQCMLCPETRALEVHHRTYARIGHERPSDLVVLCYWCHRKHHGTLQSNQRRCTEESQPWLPFEHMVPTGAENN